MRIARPCMPRESDAASVTSTMRWRWLPCTLKWRDRSQADHRDDQLAPVWSAAVLPQVDRLPGAKEQLAVADGDRLGGAGEGRADVRGHVVRAFGAVLVVGVLGRDAIRPALQVALDGRVGVLLDHERCTGVLEEDGAQTSAHGGAGDCPADLGGHVVQPAPARRQVDLLLVDLHGRNTTPALAPRRSRWSAPPCAALG